MKITQKNLENIGIIEVDDLNIPGYSYYDGVHYKDDTFDNEHYQSSGRVEDMYNSYGPLAKKIINQYPNAKLILEIGCGDGSLSHNIQRLNNDLIIVTLDGNPDAGMSPYINPDYFFLCTK